MILAAGDQPVKQLDRGGAAIGLLRGALAQLHQCIRFFGSCGKDAAWPVVFKGSANQLHAICQQCRRQRVAGISGQVAIVPAKGQGMAAINLAAINASRLRHLDLPVWRATSRAISTLVISCVTVLRVTTSHDRSPCS